MRFFSVFRVGQTARVWDADATEIYRQGDGEEMMSREGRATSQIDRRPPKSNSSNATRPNTALDTLAHLCHPASSAHAHTACSLSNKDNAHWLVRIEFKPPCQRPVSVRALRVHNSAY